ncbi:MAG: glucosidase [Verrucomicrobia bacterium]|nr:glucosidase [Verrucomicrobiota bacterium]
MNAEQARLAEDLSRNAHWRRWGPYLSERQWGTVREDYSADGQAWTYFPHEHARSRAYRWGEDGLLGWCDNHARLCFAPAVWNEADPILKERAFGLAGPEGNHGEDLKEYYYYLDSTPTHSYNKALYKYPQREFPYRWLYEENRRRGFADPEFELIDTGIFEDNRYFDLEVEYAKAGQDDMLIRLTATNRGPEAAPLHLVPQLWFKNIWAFGKFCFLVHPLISQEKTHDADFISLKCIHPQLPEMEFYAPEPDDLLFTENETNAQLLYQSQNKSPYVKDAFHRYIVQGEAGAVNPQRRGTKVGLRYRRVLAPGESFSIKLRLAALPTAIGHDPLGADFDKIFAQRIAEADEFYRELAPASLDEDSRRVQRQALAGMLWSKQCYQYSVEDWLVGDPEQPAPPAARWEGRNSSWTALFNDDVLSMPDKWEFPWYASWDLAFHMIPFSIMDPDFAKKQLITLTREWYMHPNGQIPAYEWNFSDVNPPVHAWAAWRVYTIERRARGVGDTQFLERVFQKLLLNFTWWVNRKDTSGRNVFEGGFLGLDNIGVFDRSQPLPTGGTLEQSDGTSWMAMYALNLLKIALELAQVNPVYEDIASKFFEHFLSIAGAMNYFGGGRKSLWNHGDGFYYDQIRFPDGTYKSIKLRSMVGLIPLFAIETVDRRVLDRLPGFTRRMQWFLDNRPEKAGNLTHNPDGQRLMFSIVSPDYLRRILARMLDENEFLGPYGIRSLSKFHEHNPYTLRIDGREYRVDYNPGESTSGIFGGNSNWRGPVWMPMNYLLIESLQKFHHYFGDNFKVECPTGSGNMMTLWQVANEISRRLTRIFRRDEVTGRRAVFGHYHRMQEDPHWRDHILFHEYFHADDGSGRGASHQTGWTGLIAKLVQQVGAYEEG